MLTNVTFKGNMAYGDFGGGGVFDGRNNPSFTNCLFTDNLSTVGEALVFINAGGNLNNCVIANNVTFQDAGGLWMENSTLTFSNSVFSGNRGATYGGAIRNRSSNITLTNCTFFNNRSGINANSNPYIQSGVMAIDGSNPVTTIRNAIIWGNASVFDRSSPTITYSIVQGGWSGTGNLNQSPVFQNSNRPAGADGIFATADDGLTLTPYSPGENAGNNAGMPATDLAGSPRIVGGTVDMGSYEVQVPIQNGQTWYLDADGDGYAVITTQSCSRSMGNG